MKTTGTTLDKNIKKIVHEIETKFEGISIKVFYFDMENIHYIMVPKKYFKNTQFQKFVFEIDKKSFINDITNYYIVDNIHDKELEKVYTSPELEIA